MAFNGAELIQSSQHASHETTFSPFKTTYNGHGKSEISETTEVSTLQFIRKKSIHDEIASKGRKVINMSSE